MEGTLNHYYEHWGQVFLTGWRHFLYTHFCLRTHLPPNLGMSLQKTHLPQLSCRHPAHLLQATDLCRLLQPREEEDCSFTWDTAEVGELEPDNSAFNSRCSFLAIISSSHEGCLMLNIFLWMSVSTFVVKLSQSSGTFSPCFIPTFNLWSITFSLDVFWNSKREESY